MAPMFTFSRKTDYALLALARLAEGAHRAGERLSARGLAASERLPAPLLMNLLKALHQAGLVSSIRGAQGGYRLARRPEAITIGDVVRAIEGPVEVTLCCHPVGAAQAAADRDAQTRLSTVALAAPPAAAPEAPPEAAPAHVCQLLSSCRISASIRQLNQRLEEFFDRVTLADLVRPEAQRPATLTYTAISA